MRQIVQSLAAVSTVVGMTVVSYTTNSNTKVDAMDGDVTTMDTTGLVPSPSSTTSGTTRRISQQQRQLERRADRILIRSCQSCHVGHPAGPPFWRNRMCIFNQPAGGGGYYTSDYPYSQAFLLHTTNSNSIISNNNNNNTTNDSRVGTGGIIWNETTLDRWIENPQQVIPGTTMPNPGISDPMERRAIILTLRSFCIEPEEEDGGKVTANGQDYGVQKHPETEAPATNVSSSTTPTTNNLSLFYYSWMTPMLVVSWVLITSTSGR